MTALEAALSYAARGWRVVPIRPGEKRPRGEEWQRTATTDPELIADIWTRWSDHGVGIVCGVESGIFVLDVDVANGKFGDEVLADLEAEHGPLPDTVEVVTGSGGRHLYFAMPPGVVIGTNASGLGPGLDVRGEGGQVLAPPTVHPNGRRYEWEASSHPDDVAVADAPDWLIELLTRAPDPAAASRERRYETGDDTPGNVFARSVSWPELLEADGARYLGTRTDRRSGTTYEVWARPGAEHTSATLYYRGSDVLKVFTDGWGGIDADTGAFWSLEQNATYTRFGYYAQRHHGGDHHAAARELARAASGDLDAWIVETVAAARSVPQPASSPDDEEAPATDGTDDWEDPMPLGAPAPAPYPLDVLPAWMADYCAVLADEIQVPVDLCAQVALGVWSAACAGHAKIHIAGRWVEHLNLFLAAVMPSGAGKSPVSKRLTAPLRQLEAELVELSAKSIAEAKAARKQAENAQREAEKSGDAARMAAAYLAVEQVEVPAPPRLVVDDVTQEMLAVLLHRQGGRMALISTEATMFDMACGLYSGGRRVNNNVYLQGWSADPLVIDRKGSSAGDGTEIRIPEPVLTVAITVQPSTIAELRKHPELAGRGFTARFMYAMPDTLLGRRDRWKLLDEGDADAAETYRDTFLAAARRFASWQLPVTLEASAEAARLFVAWTHDMEPLLAPDADYDAIGEWTAKAQASVARVAGLLHLADGRGLQDEIDEATMARAIRLGDYWVSHALAIAEMWEGDDIAGLARTIVTERFATGEITEFDGSDIHRLWHRRRIDTVAADRGVAPRDVVYEILEVLVDHGYTRAIDGGPVQRLGQKKAKQRFVVNPRAIRPMCHPSKSGYCARLSKEREITNTLSPSTSPPSLSPTPESARNIHFSESGRTNTSRQPSGWLWADPNEDGVS